MGARPQSLGCLDAVDGCRIRLRAIDRDRVLLPGVISCSVEIAGRPPQPAGLTSGAAGSASAPSPRPQPPRVGPTQRPPCQVLGPQLSASDSRTTQERARGQGSKNGPWISILLLGVFMTLTSVVGSASTRHCPGVLQGANTHPFVLTWVSIFTADPGLSLEA